MERFTSTNHHLPIDRHFLDAIRDEVQATCQKHLDRFPLLRPCDEDLTKSYINKFSLRGYFDDPRFEPEASGPLDFLAAFDKGLYDAIPDLVNIGYNTNFLLDWVAPLRKKISLIQESASKQLQSTNELHSLSGSYRFRSWFGNFNAFVGLLNRIIGFVRITIVGFSVMLTTVTTFLYGIWPGGIEHLENLYFSVNQYWDAGNASDFCSIGDYNHEAGTLLS